MADDKQSKEQGGGKQKKKTFLEKLMQGEIDFDAETDMIK
jgi:hypothetical protein